MRFEDEEISGIPCCIDYIHCIWFVLLFTLSFGPLLVYRYLQRHFCPSLVHRVSFAPICASKRMRNVTV